MKQLLRIEEALQFIFSIYLFNQLDFAWWMYPALFLAPDLSMLGYLVNARVGAIAYNLAHHKGLALAIYLAGLYFQDATLQLTGIVLFGHAAFDRMLGYGLKYTDSFQNTHLGRIGRS